MNPETPEQSYDQRARTVRLALTAVFTFPVALIVASIIFPIFDGHPLHRGSFLFVVLLLGFPVWGPVVAFVSLLLIALDRKFAREGGVTGKQSLIICGFAAVALASGFFGMLLGALAIWILLFWLLTGRVLGRPGWSIRSLHEGPLAERLFFVGVCSACTAVGLIFVTVAGLVAYVTLIPPSYGEPPYQARFGQSIDTSEKLALVRFPDTQSCLVRGSDASKREDLLRMDWDRILTKSDAKVCTFRLLRAWGDVSQASAWMQAQGFRSEGHQSSEAPYESSGGRLRVSGSWASREKGPRFPTGGLFFRLLNAQAYAMSMSATYGSDGKRLLWVYYGFTIK